MRTRIGRMVLFCLTVSLVGIVPCTAQQTTGQEKKPAEPAKQNDRKPGKDRWPVKTASDADAGEVNRKPTKTTVEKLLAMQRPIDLPVGETPEHYQNHRARPAETSVWTVEADVVDCRLMPDGDYRVTIRGASGKTLVLEMPKPEPEFVDPNSPFFKEIKAAREQFDSKTKPESTQKPLALHARITGIGFWARKWNRNAAANPSASPSPTPTPSTPENLIQLHPVLKLEWLDKPTKEFTTVEKKEADTTKRK